MEGCWKGRRRRGIKKPIYLVLLSVFVFDGVQYNDRPVDGSLTSPFIHWSFCLCGHHINTCAVMLLKMNFPQDSCFHPESDSKQSCRAAVASPVHTLPVCRDYFGNVTFLYAATLGFFQLNFQFDVVTTNTDGKRWDIVRNIQRFHAYRCWNEALNSGVLLGCNSTNPL